METGSNFLFPSYRGKVTLTGPDFSRQYRIDLKCHQQ